MAKTRRSRIRHAAILSALLSGCASAAEPPPTPPVAAAPASSGAGLYTVAQAERGKEVFDGICSACHGNNEFRGRMFEHVYATPHTIVEAERACFERYEASFADSDPTTAAAGTHPHATHTPASQDPAMSHAPQSAAGRSL